MGRQERIVRRFLVVSQSEQLLDCERRSMLVELAAARRRRRRGRRCRRRTLVIAGQHPERSVEVPRAEDGPGTEAERRRAGLRHDRLHSGRMLRQTCHHDDLTSVTSFSKRRLPSPVIYTDFLSTAESTFDNYFTISPSLRNLFTRFRRLLLYE